MGAPLDMPLIKSWPVKQPGDRSGTTKNDKPDEITAKKAEGPAQQVIKKEKR